MENYMKKCKNMSKNMANFFMFGFKACIKANSEIEKGKCNMSLSVQRVGVATPSFKSNPKREVFDPTEHDYMSKRKNFTLIGKKPGYKLEALQLDLITQLARKYPKDLIMLGEAPMITPEARETGEIRATIAFLDHDYNGLITASRESALIIASKGQTSYKPATFEQEDF